MGSYDTTKDHPCQAAAGSRGPHHPPQLLRWTRRPFLGILPITMLGSKTITSRAVYPCAWGVPLPYGCDLKILH